MKTQHHLALPPSTLADSSQHPVHRQRVPTPRQPLTRVPTELPWTHQAPGYDCLFYEAPPILAPMPVVHPPPVRRTHGAILWSAALVVFLVGVSVGLGLGLSL